MKQETRIPVDSDEALEQAILVITEEFQKADANSYFNECLSRHILTKLTDLAEHLDPARNPKLKLDQKELYNTIEHLRSDIKAIRSGETCFHTLKGGKYCCELKSGHRKEHKNGDIKWNTQQGVFPTREDIHLSSRFKRNPFPRRDRWFQAEEETE